MCLITLYGKSSPFPLQGMAFDQNLFVSLRYAVPVQALSIVLALDLPLHGLYEGLLDACLQMGAAHEVRLYQLLPVR